jgi:hypothetical protein
MSTITYSYPISTYPYSLVTIGGSVMGSSYGSILDTYRNSYPLTLYTYTYVAQPTENKTDSTENKTEPTSEAKESKTTMTLIHNPITTQADSRNCIPELKKLIKMMEKEADEKDKKIADLEGRMTRISGILDDVEKKSSVSKPIEPEKPEHTDAYWQDKIDKTHKDINEMIIKHDAEKAELQEKIKQQEIRIKELLDYCQE